MDLGDFSWPLAIAAMAVVWALVDHWDDARLDDLRAKAVEVCADQADSANQLADCVQVTIEATGQGT